MTFFRVLALGALVTATVAGAAASAFADEGQRARIRPESSGDAPAPAAEAPAARAVSRAPDERRAVERPSRPQEAAVPAAAASISAPAASSSSSRDSSRRDYRPTGPTIVTPSVSVPVSVGGVRVGEPFVVGNAFAVGHVPTQPDDYARRDYDERRWRNTELVPVPVPVYVPVEVYADSGAVYSDYVDSDSGGDVPGPAALSRAVRDLGRNSDRMRETSSQSERQSSSYFRFVPWFAVGKALTAGVPVALPSPDQFEERNVSENVLIETVDATLTKGVRRQYALGVGGLAFAIKPADAAVYIDGVFVGSANDFAPDREPLLLKAGAYTLELRAEGFVVDKFTVYVTMGEVLPFSGSLVKVD